MVKSIFRSRQHYDRDDRWRYSRYRDGRYDSRYDRDRDRRYSRYDWDRDRDWSYDRDRYSANPSRNHYNVIVIGSRHLRTRGARLKYELRV